MAATRKTDLHTVTRKEFEKLDQLIATTNPITATQKHADDTPNKDVIAHRAHWITLFLGWHANGMAGKPVHFPVKGYKWNDLKRYNADLHAQQVNIDWPAAVALLQANYARLDVFICALSDDALYGGPMKGANYLWPMGRSRRPKPFSCSRQILTQDFQGHQVARHSTRLIVQPALEKPHAWPFPVHFVPRSPIRLQIHLPDCGTMRAGAQLLRPWR